MSSIEIARILQLPSSERIELIGLIWDSLVERSEIPLLTPDRIEELDRRLNELQRDRSKAIPWEQAHQAVRSGRKSL